MHNKVCESSHQISKKHFNYKYCRVSLVVHASFQANRPDRMHYFNLVSGYSEYFGLQWVEMSWYGTLGWGFCSLGLCQSYKKCFLPSTLSYVKQSSFWSLSVLMRNWDIVLYWCAVVFHSSAVFISNMQSVSPVRWSVGSSYQKWIRKRALS